MAIVARRMYFHFSSIQIHFARMRSICMLKFYAFTLMVKQLEYALKLIMYGSQMAQNGQIGMFGQLFLFRWKL